MTAEFTDLMPEAEYAKQGWVDCLRWASSNTEAVAQFCAETGTALANAPVEDEVLGVKFTRWFNANIWGEIDGRACNGDEE